MIPLSVLSLRFFARVGQRKNEPTKLKCVAIYNTENISLAVAYCCCICKSEIIMKKNDLKKRLRVLAEIADLKDGVRVGQVVLLEVGIEPGAWRPEIRNPGGG